MRHITPYNKLNEKLGVARFVEEFAEVLRPFINERDIKGMLGQDYIGLWAKGGVTFVFDFEGELGYVLGEFKRWELSKQDPVWIDDNNDAIKKMQKIMSTAGVNLPKFYLVLWPESKGGVVGQQAGNDTISLAMDRHIDDIDSTLMHELNHLYQDHKGWVSRGYFSGGGTEIANITDEKLKDALVRFNRLIYLSMKNEVDARIPQAYDDLVLAGKNGLPLSNPDTFRRQIKVLSGYRDAMELINQKVVKQILSTGDEYDVLNFWHVWTAHYGKRHVVGYRADSGSIEEIDIDDDLELLKKIRDLKATKDERRKKAEEEEYARTHTPEMLARQKAKDMATAKRFMSDWSKVFARRGKELKWKIARLYDKFVPTSEGDLKRGTWMEFKYKGKPFTGKYRGKEGDYHVFSGNWDDADSLSGVTAKLSGPYIRLVIKKMKDKR